MKNQDVCKNIAAKIYNSNDINRQKAKYHEMVIYSLRCHLAALMAIG